MLPLIYHPSYSFTLPAKHRFPIGKYQRLRECLEAELAGRPHRYVRPEPDETLPLRWHCRDYGRQFLARALSAGMERRIGFPQSPALVERTLASVAGTLETARQALSHGLALHLSGGYHHAHFAQGGGFCIFNDLAIAGQELVASGEARRVLIFDCDVHQGDGTATMVGDHPDVISVSIHAMRNYPARKPDSDWDLALDCGTGDDAYLAAVEQALSQSLRLYQPDLVLYDAGVDIHVDDELGHFQVSTRGVLARDRLVLGLCRQAEVPVAGVIGGGYQRDLQKVVDLHLLLFRAAMELV
ncbi:histone deacetylase [Gallaecimonas sp. GXIMD4217]|uniref:histone deacetylase family protein n=1 Tax=Gallaecimonas sp. GXIMD4217 TaxID=3131927 RepID=UPI00311B0572